MGHSTEGSYMSNELKQRLQTLAISEAPRGRPSSRGTTETTDQLRQYRNQWLHSLQASNHWPRGYGLLCSELKQADAAVSQLEALGDPASRDMQQASSDAKRAFFKSYCETEQREPVKEINDEQTHSTIDQWIASLADIHELKHPRRRKRQPDPSLSSKTKTGGGTGFDGQSKKASSLRATFETADKTLFGDKSITALQALGEE